MPYGQSALRAHAQAGDPFLGGLIKGVGKIVGKVGSFVPGPVGGLMRMVGGAAAPRARGRPQILAPMPGRQFPLGGLGFGPGPAQRRMRVDPQTGEMRPARRRMNYSNQKALRRALRRATGYARQQKAVRKAASEFAREFGPRRRSPRRDLPRGHVHVR